MFWGNELRLGVLLNGKLTGLCEPELLLVGRGSNMYLMQKYDNTFIKCIWCCYSGCFCDILSFNVKMYLWLKLYTVPFFVSGQTYTISKGSNNYCPHCKYSNHLLCHSYASSGAFCFHLSSLRCFYINWLESTCGKLNWLDIIWKGTHLSI